MQLVKQSTVTTVYVGPVLDSTGAAVTTAVLGDFRLIKNGTAATLTGATVTHDANGYYTIALTTGNTDTAGRLTIAVGNTAMSMSTHRYSVLLESVYDAIITNATNATGGLPTATAAISAFAGAISTFAGGAVASVTGAVGSVTNRVTANVDQWNGVTATGMPMPTYTQPAGFLTTTFPTTVASPTNITSASGVVLAGVTHTGAVIPTVSTVTNGVTVTTNNDKTGYTASTVSDKTGYSLLATTGLGNQTANITGNLSGSVGSVTGAVGSVTSGVTVSDKTGFKLASDGLALVTAWTVGITGNLTGNVTGSVGSISGVTFPSNFSSLGISPTGVIVTVGTVEELGANALTANDAVDAIPPAVWNALTTETYVDGSFGDRSLISTNNTREVAVTGSHHVAAVMHDAEPNSIPEDAFVTGALSARALAADAATEIATAVGTLQVLTRLDSMIESDGAGQFRFDTIALQMAPSGGGGGGTDWTANERTAIRAILGVPTSGTTPTDPTVGILDTIRDSIGGASTINVYPVSASTPERVAGTTITYYRSEIRTVSVVTDFTLTALTLVFIIEDSEGNDLLTIADGSISRSDKTFTVSIGTAVTATISNYRWALRDITGGSNSVIARGVLTVQEAASA